jgi:hypothetical protein
VLATKVAGLSFLLPEKWLHQTRLVSGSGETFATVLHIAAYKPCHTKMKMLANSATPESLPLIGLETKNVLHKIDLGTKASLGMLEVAHMRHHVQHGLLVRCVQLHAALRAEGHGLPPVLIPLVGQDEDAPVKGCLEDRRNAAKNEDPQSLIQRPFQADRQSPPIGVLVAVQKSNSISNAFV